MGTRRLFLDNEVFRLSVRPADYQSQGTNWEAINDVSFDNIASYGTTSLG